MNYEYKIFKEKESTRNTGPVKQELLRLLRKKEFDGVTLLIKINTFEF